MNNVAENLANAIKVNDHFCSFCKQFHLFQLFKSCNIKKMRGFTVKHVFSVLFLLIFTNKNLYRYIKDIPHPKQDLSTPATFRYDTAYRFLSKSKFHWRKLLLQLTSRIIHQFILPLNNPGRVTALVIDDTLLERSCSKKVEKLAFNFDHTIGESVKSHVMLNLLWTDGATNLPVAFSLVSSQRHYVDHQLSMRKSTSPLSSLSYRRREESTLPKPEIALSLLESAIQNNITAHYVLYDCWYSNPDFIKTIFHQYHHHSICMVKRNKTYYQYQESRYNLDSLYEICCQEKAAAKAAKEAKTAKAAKEGLASQKSMENEKREANSITSHDKSNVSSRTRVGEDPVDLVGSMVITMGEDPMAEKQATRAQELAKDPPLSVKIVFVESRDKKAKREWLAILSTNTALSDEEIIRIYGKRWNVEVFHKSIKSILKVEKEFILRNFDSIIAYVTLTCIRFCFLSWMGRSRQDQRTCGELFYEFYDEVRDIQYVDAMERVLHLFVAFLSKVLKLSEDYLTSLLALFLSTLPCCILESLRVIKCET